MRLLARASPAVGVVGHEMWAKNAAPAGRGRHTPDFVRRSFALCTSPCPPRSGPTSDRYPWTCETNRKSKNKMELQNKKTKVIVELLNREIHHPQGGRGRQWR